MPRLALMMIRKCNAVTKAEHLRKAAEYWRHYAAIAALRDTDDAARARKRAADLDAEADALDAMKLQRLR